MIVELGTGEMQVGTGGCGGGGGSRQSSSRGQGRGNGRGDSRCSGGEEGVRVRDDSGGSDGGGMGRSFIALLEQDAVSIGTPERHGHELDEVRGRGANSSPGETVLKVWFKRDLALGECIEHVNEQGLSGG